ncbi:MAG TPA: cytochrome C oxidase subunit IV family protein [Candidatus Angelobacter sp.]|jgi:cytochrome c oxidase subunit 4|nr:cytochrome C oxidase subunit IV family protein [Candidatus Angelobacter sp.]
MSDHSHSHPTPGLYLIIFIALVIGTCATWGIAFIDLGVWNPVIALAIAVTKATLVVLFFMHIYYSSKLTKITISAGIFWLLIMITMSLSDYLTRTFLPQ